MPAHRAQTAVKLSQDARLHRTSHAMDLGVCVRSCLQKRRL